MNIFSLFFYYLLENTQRAHQVYKVTHLAQHASVSLAVLFSSFSCSKHNLSWLITKMRYKLVWKFLQKSRYGAGGQKTGSQEEKAEKRETLYSVTNSCAV